MPMNFGSSRLHFFLLNIAVLSVFLLLVYRMTTPSQQIAFKQDILSIFNADVSGQSPTTGLTDKPMNQVVTTSTSHPFPVQTSPDLPSHSNVPVSTVLNRLKKAVANAWNYNDSNNDLQMLSRRMNLMLMELNQFMCELYDNETTTGAWCVNDFKTGHMTDVRLATAVARMLENCTVASFGDGPGQYKRIVQQHGLVKSYDAYDGSPMIEQLTDGNVTFLDLSMPQYGLPLYDWIMSLEVIEHIPRQFEDIALGNLVRHAKIGLILSWATTGQGGIGHVNERSDAYVVEKLRALCFERDLERSFYLQEQAEFHWLKSNIYVYMRGENCTADPTLA